MLQRLGLLLIFYSSLLLSAMDASSVRRRDFYHLLLT